MGIFSLFRRRAAKDDDFEDILNGLEVSIREREERLSFIRQREKRGVVWFTTYSLLAWLLYVGAWYIGVFEWTREVLYGEQVGEKEVWEEILWTLPVGGMPIVIFFTRRIVKWWYRRKQERENKELISLRKRQREQIEKLKKLSNYDKITEMLERHGERPFPKPGTPGRNGNASTPSRPSSAYTTPVKPGAGPMAHNASTPAQQAILAAQQAGRMQQANGAKRGVFPAPPGGRPLPPGSPMQGGLNGDGLAPFPNQPKGLIDKLADALLGDSEQAPTSKYALICQRCFSHNGLVLKEEIMDIQFVCPKCGFFNPSRRRRATGDVAETPARSRQTSDAANEGSASGSARPATPPTSQENALEGDDKDETMEVESEEKLTAPMKVDERKENLRKRQPSSKGVKHKS